MKRLERRLSQVAEIIDSYNHESPFLSYLKTYFRKNKKFGKRDRTEITSLCFAYFRTGAARDKYDTETAILIGFLFSEETDSEDLELINKRLNLEIDRSFLTLDFNSKNDILKDLISLDLEKDILNSEFDISDGVTQKRYSSFLLQKAPVFIKVLFGQKAVIKEFEECGIEFIPIDANSYSLSSDVKLQQLKSWKEGNFYIQDFASQNTLNNISPSKGEQWWDACCGAGGKSLLFKTLYKDVSLSSSDVRPNMLDKFKARLEHHKFEVDSFVYDLSKSRAGTISTKYDGIILDAPCSGSGTWRRAPENIALFTKEMLASYTTTQRNLIKNAAQFLKIGGTLQYITCSIFKAENEDVVDFACNDLRVECKSQGIVNLEKESSDYLYTATLTKTE